MLDINKISFAQMFNDSKGRTSPGKMAGFYACVISVTVFGFASIIAILYKDEHSANIISVISMQAVGLFVAGGTLLGIRRFTPDKDIT